MRSVQPQQFRLDYDEFAFETNLPLHSLLSKYLTSDFHFNLRENSLLDLRGGHRLTQFTVLLKFYIRDGDRF